MAAEWSIAELADEAGISARAVRFYVQQKLLPPPLGRGRGSHYTAEHLTHLRRVLALQSAGHSLEAIRRILEGKVVEAPEPPRRARAVVGAELWTRVRVGEGVELSFDAMKHRPDAEELARLREVIRDAFLRKDQV
jgi:DNA-binding transcriptional MerR regulator